MIEFNGEPTKACKDYLRGRFRILEWLIIKPITLCLLVPPFIYAAATIEEYRTYCVVFAILTAVFALAIPWTFVSKESFARSLPTLIDIDDGKMEITTFEGQFEEVDVDKVKKIVDFGEGYAFSFRFPNFNITVICQKDSLVQGTMEEFEKLFEGKIVRKNKAEG